MKILKLAQLREWLHSDLQRMRMWATYQLIENHDNEAREFVEILIDSDEEEIREAGIYLIGKQNLILFLITVLIMIIATRYFEH